MDDFKLFKYAVSNQMTKMMKNNRLYITEVSKDDLWDIYLGSFPEGTNVKFKERREYDCQACKQFIRACGNAVAIVNNKLVSIWDINVDNDTYQIVANECSKFVKSYKICNIFTYESQNVGINSNTQILNSGAEIEWYHFSYKLPSRFVNTSGSTIAEYKNNHGVILRGFNTISLQTAKIVLELIDQNSIERGKEHRNLVEHFINLKIDFDKLKNDIERDNFCWEFSKYPGIRNTVIGTLLSDISDGMELDKAVFRFNSKMDPTKYKRPTSIITKSMAKNAMDFAKSLGIDNELYYRYATPEDLSINDTIFVDRSIKQKINTNAFEDLMDDIPENPKRYTKVDTVSINNFIQNILPTTNNIEILFENKHIGNLFSLMSPIYRTGTNLLKWDNNMSWAYSGDFADSIKERVKRAGGMIDAYIRISLAWGNIDDLDLHIKEPNGNHIYYNNKAYRHRSSGMLDIDANWKEEESTDEPVENVVYIDKNKMPIGEYLVYVHQFRRRVSDSSGFELECEYDGKSKMYSFNGIMLQDKIVNVLKFKVDRNKNITITDILSSEEKSIEKWGIKTSQFHKVSTMLNSPNYWGNNKTGNKHYFFTIEKCLNPGTPRGFFNEYLRDDLTPHRKVFEVLGNKLRVEHSPNQLSGLGFSSTRKDVVTCKVTGRTSRVLQINF